MKKILVACDSFKHSLGAFKVGQIIKKAFKDVEKSLIIKNLPIADGGEGTTNALVEATQGKLMKLNVKNPLFKEVSAKIGLSKDRKTAFIEMASASGIELIKKNELNPMITSTYGTGQLILKALDLNVEKIIIGIGGSATNDGGCGMASALGVRFYDKEHNLLKPIPKELLKIDKVDLTNIDKRLQKVSIKVACDVNNPLTGFNGSSKVYGPQKGATNKMIEKLDFFLSKLKKTLGGKAQELAKLSGAGAAGGLGFGLVFFTNGKLESGFEIVRKYLNIDFEIEKSDLVITGEGQMDTQSLRGKAPVEIAKLGKIYQKPVIAFVGSLETKILSQLYQKGFSAVYSIINKISSLEDNLRNAEKNLYSTSLNVAKTIFKLS